MSLKLLRCKNIYSFNFYEDHAFLEIFLQILAEKMENGTDNRMILDVGEEFMV